jgi:hypothetical protein
MYTEPQAGESSGIVAFVEEPLQNVSVRGGDSGRVFAAGWEERVDKARQAIVDRGEDPNERLR